jgi:two-component system sensor histidine kinase KdpD
MLLDVLDFCLAEVDGLRARCAPTNLAELVANHELRFARTAAVHQASLSVWLGADPLVAQIDAELIDRMIANLLDNAAKFSPPGGRIELSIAARGDQVEVAVADAGPGLSPEQAQSVFVPFDAATPAKTPTGYGLGLVFCRLAAEAHGGTIHVEPRAPQGSRFVVRLPRGNAQS